MGNDSVSGIGSLLDWAVEDNVAWCRAVCRGHDADERLSLQTWANLRSSPRFYPNIITRKPDSQAEVLARVDEIRGRDLPEGWGIKDSFCDLDLGKHGFEAVLSGHWFALPPKQYPAREPKGWAKVAAVGDLPAWEAAWGGDAGRRVFTDALLADPRVAFWYRGPVEAIEAGFIAYDSRPSVGLSNWFSVDETMPVWPEALQAVASIHPETTVVLWSADDALREQDGLLGLAPLKVWISIR